MRGGRPAESSRRAVIRPVWSVSSARRRRRAPNRCRRPTEASADFAGRENEGEREGERQGGRELSIDRVVL